MNLVKLITYMCYYRVKPNLKNENDVMNLASTLAGTFMYVVQYNREVSRNNWDAYYDFMPSPGVYLQYNP